MTLLTPLAAHGEPSPDRVERVDESRRLPVLARLLGRDLDHALRFMRFAATEGIRLDWLWACFGDHDRVEAAAMLTPGHGRTAMLTLSPLRGRAEERAGVAVVRAALADAASQDLALVQALLEPRRATEATVLSRGGLRSLASLAYMERSIAGTHRPLAGQSEAPALPRGITFEDYDDAPESQRALTRLLTETYEDTLDCPGLTGLRSPEDVLAGHRRGGRFDPSLWTLLALDGRLIGVLLLNEALHATGLELVYLGLVPEARGRGFGRLLVDRALTIAHGRGDRAIMLAVDEENTPALRLYRAAGFRRTARRSAFVAPIPPPTIG